MSMPYFSHAGFHTTGNVPYHKHSGTEIIQVISGTCRVYSDSGFLEAKTNDIIVIPPETEHNQIDGADVENYYMVFRSGDSLFPSEWRLMKQSGNAKTEALFQELFRMTRERDPIGAEGLVYALLARLSSAAEPHPEYPKKLKTALDIIRKRCKTPLSINELAAECGTAPGYLRMLFQCYRGESPLEYLNRMRLMLAKNLLADPQLTLKEIASECGIQDVNYFIRLYRKHFGRTPGQDRENS